MSFPPATIQLDPTLHELLVLLASRLGKEKGEVLSRALSLYNYLVEESRANDIVYEIVTPRRSEGWTLE
jgi:hypothetical protein